MATKIHLTNMHESFNTISTMKRILSLLAIIILMGLPVFSQQHEEHIHDRYCRHYTEQHEIASFAYRNDWQSPYVHDYDVKFFFLDIAVTNLNTSVNGKVTIHADVTAENFSVFAFELVPEMTISQIIFNEDIYTTWIREGDNVLLTVTPGLSAGDSFVAEISYGGTPPTGGFFSGVTNATSQQWGKQVTWTLSEPFNAKQWWPTKQVLTDKADSVWVFLTTPANTMAGSQGLLTQVTDVGNGQMRYEWKSKYPIVYYLISFAVSDYQEYNFYSKPEGLDGDSILVQNFIYNHPSYLPQYKSNIDVTAPMIEVFSDLYTMYPFKDEKYGHCITQLGGGMEHQTMSTMGSWSFNLVAHELGHMWFGDNVTCATWSDIWINEGFATYSNYLAHEFLNGWNSAQNFMINTQNNVMSQPGGSVYIPPSEITEDNIWRIFNGRLSYDKGAAILHVLRHEINNDDLFFEAFRAFQTQYADTSATGEDFRLVAEQITGLDLEYFFDQWYYGQGYPIYDFIWYMQGNELVLISTQSASTTATPFFNMYMDFRLNFSDDTSDTIRLHQDENIKTFIIPVDKEVEGITVDPANWTFEKVNSLIVGSPEKSKPGFFSLYPNPATNTVTISMPFSGTENSTLRVFNTEGLQVISRTLSGNHSQIDVSGLTQGVYLVEMNSGIHRFIERLVVF